jgi:hypothetical protein
MHVFAFSQNSFMEKKKDMSPHIVEITTTYFLEQLHTLHTTYLISKTTMSAAAAATTATSVASTVAKKAMKGAKHWPHKSPAFVVCTNFLDTKYSTLERVTK